MEVVPERSALPAISPAPLVQAKEPSDVLEAAGPDLFEGLVSPQVRPHPDVLRPVQNEGEGASLWL